MRASVATGVDGSIITAPGLKRLTRSQPTSPAAVLAALWQRLIRLSGRMLFGFPASTWLIADLLLVVAGVCIAYELFPPPLMDTTPHIALWQSAAIFSFVLTVASLVFGLYERETLMSRSRILTRMLLTGATVMVTAYAIIYVVMYATVSRRVAAFSVSMFLVGGAGIRMCAWWAIHKMRRRLVVVGSNALFQSFRHAQRIGCLQEYELVGYADTDAKSATAENNSAYLGTITQQVDALIQSGVTDIVVGAEAARDPRVMDWMVPSLQRGCRVTNEAIFYEKATGQILVDQITPLWFLFADLKVHCDKQATLKRVFDLILSVVVFCLTAPAWPLIALAVKLCDGGPVFYSHDRVGQNGRVFRLYKFRTMRTDAENGKSVWASRGDPRVTRVGRLLRKTRLDELPQLYNVFMGKMSVIGPRPERPDIVDELCEKVPYYGERHLVKPGITGWAQISFHYGASVEDAKRKLQFDLYYLKHMSLELDMIIVFRTLGTFLRGTC